MRLLSLVLIATLSIASHGLTLCEHRLLTMPLTAQESDVGCGPACLRSLLKHFTGREYSERYLFEVTRANLYNGTRPAELQTVGFVLGGLYSRFQLGTTLQQLKSYLMNGEGVIVGVSPDHLSNHWVVVKTIGPSGVQLMDPMVARWGRHSEMSLEDFVRIWSMDFGSTRAPVIRFSPQPILDY